MNKDIIKVHLHSGDTTNHLVHHTLKAAWSICETERQDIIPEQAKRCCDARVGKCRVGEPHLVKCLAQVEGGKETGAVYVGEKGFGARQGIYRWNGGGVYLPPINDKPQLT